MPPEASSLARPADERDGARDLGRAHVVEQDPRRARVERLLDLVERLGLDLDRQGAVALGERCERPRRSRRRGAGGSP